MKEKLIIVSFIVLLLLCIYIYIRSIINNLYSQLKLNKDIKHMKARKTQSRLVLFYLFVLAVLLSFVVFYRNLAVYGLCAFYIIVLIILFSVMLKKYMEIRKLVKLVTNNIIRLDDYVTINEQTGKIKEISLSYITIITLNNRVVTIKANDIDTVVNHSIEPVVTYVDVVISQDKYTNDLLDHLQERIKVLSENYPDIYEGPNVLGIEALQRDITIRISVKCKYENKFTIERIIRKNVKRILDEHAKI